MNNSLKLRGHFKMKKILAVLLAVIMMFSVTSVAAFAFQQYEITFTDLPYDVAPYRADYVGQYMGYHYGVDYWFVVTNYDGTTTEIKGETKYIVNPGETFEFTVRFADYIDSSTIKVIAFDSSLAPSEIYDHDTGIPNEGYYIQRNSANMYGLRPSSNLTVCVSEYHLYNTAFLYNFKENNYYSTQRVQYSAPTSEGTPPWEVYTPIEWGNTKVVYENETLFFEVRIPLDDPAHDYHYDTYQVYYTTGVGNDMKTIYLKQNSSGDGTVEATDMRVAHYETDTDWVDVYAIENVDPTVYIKVEGTVTYTLAMLKDFFEDFDITDIDSIDFDSIDMSPILEYIVRLIGLLVKILQGFGLSVSI